MTDPEPLQSIGTLSGKSAIVQTDSGSVEDANFLEADRRVARIALEELKVLVGEPTDRVWKLPIVGPEIRIRKVIHIGLQRPAS